MIQNIEVQLCGLIPMLLICYFSFRKQSIMLRSASIYRQLLLVTTLCVTTDIISVVGIEYANEQFAVILCKLYLWLTIWTGYLTIYYLCYDITYFRRRRIVLNTATVTNGILSVFMAFLPLEYCNSNGEIYSYGSAVNFTFAFSAIYILGGLVLTYVFKAQMNPHRCLAIRIWMLLEALGAIMQFIDRSLLFVSYTMAIGVVILYTKLENPDSKIDRDTGAYSFRMLREYMREMYDAGRNCACVIISENDERERESLTADLVLLEVANFLSSVSGRKLFRGYGNDFIMIFPTANEAEAVIPKISERFQGLWNKNVMISPGIYLIRDTNITGSAAEMLSLYQYYSNYNVRPDSDIAEIDSESFRRMKEHRIIQREIIDALNDDRIEVFLQPIYSINKNRFVAAEALVRIRSKSGELVMPGEFIPVAEQCGLIEQIGDRVFEKVCEYVKSGELGEIGIDYIEVNLSVVQCENSLLAERYSNLIRSYDIQPSSINLEITETGKLRQKGILMNNMETLREFGCSFSLDDFGTGESNLNYIVEMPVDIIKFDRSMIMSYFSNDRTKLMFEYVVSMIKNMGMEIVAEGIEEKYQLDAIAKLGVDYIQGYYFSKPVPKNEFISFVSSWKE